MEKKCLVMYSDGLDSRLAVKIMQEQGFEVTGLLLQLPFAKGVKESSLEFAKDEGFELKVLDYTKGALLKEYLDMIRHHKYPIGKGHNPCIDCKVLMFEKAKEVLKELGIDMIVSGEVVGERPLSQSMKALRIISEDTNVEVLKPLSAKVLDETSYEKSGLVDRKKLCGIEGRARNTQMDLAKKFNIDYPTPSGGCLLCEKDYRVRVKEALNRDLINEEFLPILKTGRHFIIDDIWFTVSRDEEESFIIEKAKNSLDSGLRMPAVYYSDKKGLSVAKELQVAYRERKADKFREFKI